MVYLYPSGMLPNSTRDAFLYKHVAHVEWDTASERRQFRGKIGFDSFQSTQRAFNVTVHSAQNWTKTESVIQPWYGVRQFRRHSTNEFSLRLLCLSDIQHMI